MNEVNGFAVEGIYLSPRELRNGVNSRSRSTRDDEFWVERDLRARFFMMVRVELP